MATRDLIDVRERIASAAARSGRDANSVTLLAVSKGRSNEDVRDLYEAGQRFFGENRPQGLRDRLDGELPADIIWHFVGNVQRRAVKTIAPVIDLLHSLDRASLANAWARLDRPPPVLIEVNIGDEPQKHGFAPSDVHDIADQLATGGVSVRGLMIIPPRVQIAEDARRWFVALRELRDTLVVEHPGARELSMGMTDDFEVAVEEGASIVRVGRAIFGPTDNESNAHSLED
ncbi:MAG: YggS family pyridoxal phosphate-dependent enzyme [Actinomycetota bacterium]|nr:YggS family pyridoxal phosphate-dependent enzyme [Actinomycetota bacterium]